MKKKFELPTLPGWTTTNSVATECDKCQKFQSLGKIVFWRKIGETAKEIRTEIFCEPCANEKALPTI